MKLKPGIAATAAALILVGGIFLSQLLGFWTTESTKVPATFTNVEGLEGTYRPDDIRGSYTFGEISSLYKVPLEHLAEAFGVAPSKAEAFKCKDLEDLYADFDVEIGTGSVRMFVAFYLGQPYTFDDTYLPAAAGSVIAQYGNPTPEQLDYLQSHVIGSAAPTPEADRAATEDTAPSSSGTGSGAQNGSGTPASTGSGSLSEINVKGSDYLTDLASAYNIPLGDFAVAFLLTDLEAKNFQVKDIKNKFLNAEAEIGTSAVKLFIACYNGIAVDLSETSTNMTRQGTDIILQNGSPLPEQIEYLNLHTVEII